jgi:hypothetical protein
MNAPPRRIRHRLHYIYIVHRGLPGHAFTARSANLSWRPSISFAVHSEKSQSSLVIFDRRYLKILFLLGKVGVRDLGIQPRCEKREVAESLDEGRILARR